MSTSDHVRRAAPLALVAVLVAVGAVLTLAPGAANRRVWVEIPDATGLYAGEPIREAGLDVGTVASVDPVQHGTRARVGLDIGTRLWPLTRGVRLSLRWGGTISYLNDYLDLTQPPRPGVPYPEGATLPTSALRVPVQFDSLLDDFTPAVRAGLRSTLVNGGSALQAAEQPLRDTITQAPVALTQADAVLSTLDGSQQQLTALIGATTRVVDAFDTSQPSVAELVRGAASTLQAVGSQAASMRDTLSRAPQTFAETDATLATADRTLDLAGHVTTALSPGVTQLRAAAQPLDQLLQTIVRVTPDAEATLTTAGRSAPEITHLLQTATTLMPTIGSVIDQSAPQLGCIRPYTPDIAAFFTNWGAFLSPTDGTDYIARVVPSAILPALTGVQTDTPAQAIAQFPGFTDSFPRPPGESAGQPWYQPQCGVTPDALNPADDPEAGNASPAPLPLSSVAHARSRP